MLRCGVYHVMRNYGRVPEAVVRAYASLDVATVHEAHGKQGAMAAPIKPIYPGMRVCGTALTVRCQPGDNLMLHKAIDILSPGEVLVVDMGGWEGGPWGDLMSVAAKARKCAGLVIDGYVRDGRAIREHGFNVFARGLSVKGAFKEDLGLINHPVSCGGVIVEPGDLVLGGDDGVCAVPKAAAADVLERANARVQDERRSRAAFARGETPWRIAGYQRAAVAKGMREEPIDGAMRLWPGGQAWPHSGHPRPPGEGRTRSGMPFSPFPREPAWSRCTKATPAFLPQSTSARRSRRRSPGATPTIPSCAATPSCAR
jgi:4-hydroxy-4-methyl-2-oxoglutarate aldolase